MPNGFVAHYARVSTDDQADRGTIENQLEFGRKYCDLHQIENYQCYKDDGVTGTIPLQERPAGETLLNDAKEKKFDTLLVYRLDRLGRSARVILNAVYELEQYGIKVKSMTEPFDTGDPSGRFLLTILAGVADLERSTILDRLWHGANRAARAGQWLGGIVPYGYFVDDDKHLQISTDIIPGTDLSEADVVNLIFSLSTSQHMSTIKICDYLNALHIPPSYTLHGRKIAKGKRKENTAGCWSPHQIGRMLKNSTYKGIHIYGKRSNKDRELIRREVPAIVEPEIWDRAQTVIKENSLDIMRNKVHQYLVGGLIKCGSCGHTYVGTSYNAYGTDKKKTYYCCVGKQAYKNLAGERCRSKNIPGAWIDNLVWNDCLHFIMNPGEALKIIDTHIKKQSSDKEKIHSEIVLLSSSISQKESERQSILDLFRKKLISAQDVEQQFTKIKDETLLLQNRRSELEIKLNSFDDSMSEVDDAEEYLASLREKVQGVDSSFEQKRQIVKSMVKKITVNTKLIHDKPQAFLEIQYTFGSPRDPNTRVSVRLLW